MLACGTGIAPMLQVMQIILDKETDETFLHLIYTSPTQHTVLLKDLLDQYSAYWNVKITYVLSRVTEEGITADPGVIKYGDKVHYGRLGCDVVRNELPEGSVKNFVLICGTRSFDKDMLNYLSKLGYTESMYHKF